MTDYRDPRWRQPIVLARWGLPHVVPLANEARVVDTTLTTTIEFPMAPLLWCWIEEGLGAGWNLVRFLDGKPGEIIAQIFAEPGRMVTLRSEPYTPPSQVNGQEKT